MSIQPGTHSYVEVNRPDCQDQRDRVEELQQAIYHAATIMGAVSCQRIEEPETQAVTYFAAYTLEMVANGQAEDAVNFMRTFCRQIRVDTDPQPDLAAVNCKGGAA